KANSTALTEDYDNNLYCGTFQMGQLGNDHTQFRITENEAVKLITRVVKEISKIKKDRAQYLVDNTIKGTTLDENGNKIEHPDKGKPANGHRIEYSFGDDYTKNDGSPVATNNFTHTELEQLFNLMRLFGDTLILLPAEEKPIPSSKFKLEEFGIEGYVDNNGNSNFYATNYGTRISDGSEYRPVEYNLIAEEIKSGRQELEQAEKDYQAARKQLFAKEKELDNKITAKITELRQELKEKYKVSDTEANDFTGDNKITTSDHRADEKVNRQRTDEERIALEKLVKLSDRETEIKIALKKAIDNQTPEENAKD
ncbi:8050_t:CDS:2, partial [Paraglomus brasilianum]